jgi:hypothetical protein
MTSRSFFLLGWSFFKTVLRRPFARRGAARRTLDRLAPDRLAPLDAGDRAALLGAGGCLACGRCDREAGRGGTGERASDAVLARSRDLSGLVAADPWFEAGAERYAAACPGGVPFEGLDRCRAALAARIDRRAIVRVGGS